MNIAWHGQTCFRIISQQGKNGSVNILIDPPEKETGLRSPKLEADILLSTTNKKISNGAFLILGPGEYDIKGTYIQGIPGFSNISQRKGEQNISNEITIYTIETGGMKICHLGMVGQEELKSEQLEEIGDVDILMIPIGGGRTVDARGAVKIMSQIEPKIIIPMYYRIPKLKTKLDGLDKFLKILGIKSLQPLPKLSIKKKDLSEEEAKIIVLSP